MNLYRAIYKSVSGRFITYIVQFSALALYARLFTPEEFGVIASIQVFVLFFQMLSDVGIGPAIINETKFEIEKRDGMFTFTALIGISLAIIFYFFSYLLNFFYGGYEYQNIAILVSIAIFFNSLNILPITAMNKDARFIELAVIDVSVEIFSVLLIFILYKSNFGLLSLAARSPITAVIKFTMTWILCLKTDLGRPNFGTKLYHIKSILRFSLFQFGFNFINYFSRNLDNILIAKYFGMISVGIYEKAYQLMRYPLMITTFAMTPAIQPILMVYRNEVNLIIEEHNKLTKRLLTLSLPISAFIYLNSKVIVLTVFGEQWYNVEPLIKIFSFMIPVQAVLSTSGSFFQVMNKPNLLFYSGFLSAILNIIAVCIGVLSGDMNTLAIALVVTFTINFFQAYFILFKYCFAFSLKGFYFGLFKGAIVTFWPIFIYSLIQYYLLSNINLSSILSLFVNILVGTLVILVFMRPIKNQLK
ncbi:oligosaccharide flippase family protein [Shewanella sp. AS1]|uniref:oligosaccharide flippase family protein n=1 Tax=Shewanella sp. AS1 TaxID=2907626 RepID=UPI001F3207CC|nr:oligosaccharide flippase family protein [Shewanella sp. AS1]MCE9680056.1 oligosaccharide flippase family protein [Shewanella sp. AS1]